MCRTISQKDQGLSRLSAISKLDNLITFIHPTLPVSFGWSTKSPSTWSVLAAEKNPTWNKCVTSCGLTDDSSGLYLQPINSANAPNMQTWPAVEEKNTNKMDKLFSLWWKTCGGYVDAMLVLITFKITCSIIKDQLQFQRSVP